MPLVFEAIWPADFSSLQAPESIEPDAGLFKTAIADLCLVAGSETPNRETFEHRLMFP